MIWSTLGSASYLFHHPLFDKTCYCGRSFMFKWRKVNEGELDVVFPGGEWVDTVWYSTGVVAKDAILTGGLV